jgi:hypothetical protein
MINYASELRRQVIQPTLGCLGVELPAAPDLLVACALLAASFARAEDGGLGLYRITPAQHRQLWDGHLAFRPELASTVRGLASQRNFLLEPDRELVTNLAYASAIAWLLLESSGETLPAAGDLDGMVQLWQQVFNTQPADSRRAADWLRQGLAA